KTGTLNVGLPTRVQQENSMLRVDLKTTAKVCILLSLLLSLCGGTTAWANSPAGAFYLQSDGDSPTPYPYDPYGGQYPVYEMSPGQYLVADGESGLETSVGFSMQ